MLAWFNVALLIILTSLFLALELNKRWLKGKNKAFNQFLKRGRRIHPYVGGILIVTGILHGYFKIGRLDFHTGSLLLGILGLNGINGMPFYVAHNSIIYDVSEIPQWANGTHKGQSAGTDLTGKIEKAPYGVKNLDLVKKMRKVSSQVRIEFKIYSTNPGTELN